MNKSTIANIVLFVIAMGVGSFMALSSWYSITRLLSLDFTWWNSVMFVSGLVLFIGLLFYLDINGSVIEIQEEDG